jgi:hypothetical protein
MTTKPTIELMKKKFDPDFNYLELEDDAEGIFE